MTKFFSFVGNINGLYMSASISDIESEIIEEFSLFDDWTDKYQYIIEMGQTLPSLPAADKKEANLVRGCQSQVWLTAEEKQGIIIFHADSDAIITKGLIAMLVRVLSHQPASDIIQAELTFIDSIGLREHLFPTRANGLNEMVKKMKMYAASLANKS